MIYTQKTIDAVKESEKELLRIYARLETCHEYVTRRTSNLGDMYSEIRRREINYRENVPNLLVAFELIEGKKLDDGIYKGVEPAVAKAMMERNVRAALLVESRIHRLWATEMEVIADDHRKHLTKTWYEMAQLEQQKAGVVASLSELLEYRMSQEGLSAGVASKAAAGIPRVEYSIKVDQNYGSVASEPPPPIHPLAAYIARPKAVRASTPYVRTIYGERSTGAAPAPTGMLPIASHKSDTDTVKSTTTGEAAKVKKALILTTRNRGFIAGGDVTEAKVHSPIAHPTAEGKLIAKDAHAPTAKGQELIAERATAKDEAPTPPGGSGVVIAEGGEMIEEATSPGSRVRMVEEFMINDEAHLPPGGEEVVIAESGEMMEVSSLPVEGDRSGTT